jgi:aspartyl-tRNA(Asn)/glutamyl-tRNA(Gln) amidotransferase subunit C
MEKQIDPTLVRHIGKLARIELADEEVATFGRQLASILTYVEKLNELDTAGVEPMAHAVEIQNVFAADTPHQSLSPAEALANAPQRDGDFFMVPKVIGDSQ